MKLSELNQQIKNFLSDYENKKITLELGEEIESEILSVYAALNQFSNNRTEKINEAIYEALNQVYKTAMSEVENIEIIQSHFEQFFYDCKKNFSGANTSDQEAMQEEVEEEVVIERPVKKQKVEPQSKTMMFINYQAHLNNLIDSLQSKSSKEKLSIINELSKSDFLNEILVNKKFLKQLLAIFEGPEKVEVANIIGTEKSIKFMQATRKK